MQEDLPEMDFKCPNDGMLWYKEVLQRVPVKWADMLNSKNFLATNQPKLLKEGLNSLNSTCFVIFLKGPHATTEHPPPDFPNTMLFWWWNFWVGDWLCPLRPFGDWIVSSSCCWKTYWQKDYRDCCEALGSATLVATKECKVEDWNGILKAKPMSSVWHLWSKSQNCCLQSLIGCIYNIRRQNQIKMMLLYSRGVIPERQADRAWLPVARKGRSNRDAWWSLRLSAV